VFQLTPHSFDVAVKEDWAPDGQHLVFTKDGDILIPGVSANIATIDPDGTHLRLVNALRGWGRQRLRRLLLSRRATKFSPLAITGIVALAVVAWKFAKLVSQSDDTYPLPKLLNVIHVTCNTTSSYVISF
jgi:hypothetical protein